MRLVKPPALRTVHVSRIALTFAALGLLASGIAHAQPAPYAADPGYGAQPGYPAQPGYLPPAPPGYPPPLPPGYPPPLPPGYPPPATAYAVPAVPPGQPYTGPDGLTYVNGSPVYFVGGAYQPLVFVAGFGWGYYGFGHRFFPAPGPVRARLDRFYPGGRGFPGRGYGDRGFGYDRGLHDHGLHDHGFR